MNYEEMSIEQLEAANNELRQQRDKIRQEQLKINRVITQKELEAAAIKHLKRMGLEQAKAVAQVISKVGGIETLEKVGDVGAK